MKSLCSRKPKVVGRPATSKLSLTVIGTPASGPDVSPLSSKARAAARARSKSRTTTAFSGPSRASMRAIAASVSASAVDLACADSGGGFERVRALHQNFSPASALRLSSGATSTPCASSPATTLSSPTVFAQNIGPPR